MYAKLFSRIAQSSLMEQDVETRYCFMMLLAIADAGGDVIGTDVALARAINLPLENFKRCVAALMEPDPDSNSQVHDGRRLIPSESGRGYLIVNYVTYRSIKTAEEKKAYMREYMKEYRKPKSGKDVTDVKKCKTPLILLTHAEGEGESEGDSEGEQSSPMSNRRPTLSKTAPAELNGRGITEGKNSDRIPTSPQSLRFAAIFHRRPTTPWQENEIAAYKRLGTVDESDLAAVERYYAANWPARTGVNILRHDLLTFINNFQGEVGRAIASTTQAKPPALKGRL